MRRLTWINRVWRSVATPPRRLQVAWSLLRAHRPQGTPRSIPTTGTIGDGRSRRENVRDGLRPLEATAGNATSRVIAVRHIAKRGAKRISEGPVNPLEGACT